MRLDAHQHFWKYDPAGYGWIGEGMEVLRRDFLPADLEPLLKQAGLEGCLAVQARQDVAETEMLLEWASTHGFIRGVVGWVPLVSPDVKKILERLTVHPKFRGVRHIVQAESDPEFLLGADFNRGIRTLRDFNLVYDILIVEHQLPQAIRFVDQHPTQVFVLDHIAKPRIRENLLNPWKKHFKILAERKNVYCKLSGLVTEADFQKWTPEQLKPYLDEALRAFGPGRLMFGSDWPVCLLAASYPKCHEVIRDFISGLSADEKQLVMGGTACRAYGIGSFCLVKDGL